MDNESSKGSYVSLTESEPSVPYNRLSSFLDTSIKCTFKARESGSKFHTHKYNTRLSARRFSEVITTPLRKLYVDLSNSRVEIPQNDSLVVASYPQKVKQRRGSTSSEDSREFDFGFRDIAPRRIELREEGNMYEINPCLPRNSCLKYILVLCLTVMMYFYMELIHNSSIARDVKQDMHRLKLDFEGSRYTLAQVEGMVLKLKRDHEHLERNMQKNIARELEKFSSDKTGKTDFALESIGGKIVQLSPGTENYEQAVSVFGVKLCDGKHGPRAMIQTEMSPGYCWAIKGSTGGVIIKLLGSVKINAVSLEHISKNLSPTGEISSAPKNFSVWVPFVYRVIQIIGLKSPKERGVLLGEFAYNADGPLVQTFPISNSNHYEYVEYRILSNHGNSDFTCTYRFRVHGSLERVGH